MCGGMEEGWWVKVKTVSAYVIFLFWGDGSVFLLGSVADWKGDLNGSDWSKHHFDKLSI